MSQGQNVELVRAMIDAFNRQDLASGIAIAHPAGEIDWTRSLGPLKGVYRGHDGLREFWGAWWSVFEEVRIEPDEFIQTGDDVVVPNISHVRGRDGVRAAARSAHVYAVRDGKVWRLRLHQTREEALEAVGLR
jgi:ketosteroid isomerase-like protein